MPTRIVDVTSKPMARRLATARGRLRLRPATVDAVRAGRAAKGDVLATAQVAALMAVKRTSDILPLCHPIAVTSATADFTWTDDGIAIDVEVGTVERTGVEMEALTGAMAGLLCVWDMVKSMEKDARGEYPDTAIVNVQVLQKTKEVQE